MPDADWYAEWVNAHCTATGAAPEVAAVLTVNRAAVVDDWGATAADLHLCTRRLVAARRTPRWPNEHLNALGDEFARLRTEEHEARRDDLPTDCATCGGGGVVTVPHPGCVWNGRLVVHRSNHRLCTASVTCDACPRGRAARDAEAERAGRTRGDKLRRGRDRGRMMTHAEYTRLVHGHDGVVMLVAHEAAMAAEGRKTPGPPGWDEMMAKIRRRIAAGEALPLRPPNTTRGV